MRTLLTAIFLSCLCTTALAAGKNALVTVPNLPPFEFVAKEIESALKAAGWNTASNGKRDMEITIEGSNAAETVAKRESFKIDISQKSGFTQVKVTGGDIRGAMYGGLDVAEQIRLHGPAAIKPKSETPFLFARAMKFNLPLKGTGYMSKEDEQHNAWFYDLAYWERFMQTMAYDRYNMLTFWSAHPYNQMVRIQKYPEATTLSPEELDKNIAHFHKIFRMAQSYGLDTYLVTWNIHVSPGFAAAHNVKNGQDSPLIRDYEKECIKELLREYPELTGMGTCPGEKMPMSAAANAEWIRDVYLDTLIEIGRKTPFIYRYWGARPKETTAMLLKEKYPGEILLDIKFNGEHMYSSTKPHSERPEWLTQPEKPYKLFWHLRNDCIYQLRWGDPEFAGKVCENCGGPDSAGFVMGSEVEIPGADRNHTPETAAHRDWNYEFEKNWMRFAVWGRMGYDPKLPESYWIDRFAERFGDAAGKDAFLALKSSSSIIPMTTSFHWDYMNGDWYPEGNVGSWNTSAGMKKKNFRDRALFHDIREWIFTNVIDDSMMNIPDYVATYIVKGEKIPEDVLTPPKVAQLLDLYVAKSITNRNLAEVNIIKTNKEWQCMALDLQSSTELGCYYAEKIRAATDWMSYLASGNETFKDAAVKDLEKARDHWKVLAELTQSHYVTHEVWLMGQFDWQRYLPAVEKDIQIVKKSKPWKRVEQTWTLTDGKQFSTPTLWQADGWPKEIEPWVKDFNARAQGPIAGIEIPAGAWIKTTLHADAPGTAVIHLSAPGAKQVKAGAAGVFPMNEGECTFAVQHQAGGNEIAVQYEKPSHAAPTLELENAPAAIFLEAEEGQLTAPMQKTTRADATGGAAIYVPSESGRGEKNGKPIDNGQATYKIDIPQDGAYRLRARVFWKNTSNNSLFFAWDDGKAEILGNDELYEKWHWIETEPTTLTAGEHRLTIRNRDDNSILDCMTITPESPR
jgi:hypothetical protein